MIGFTSKELYGVTSKTNETREGGGGGERGDAAADAFVRQRTSYMRQSLQTPPIIVYNPLFSESFSNDSSISSISSQRRHVSIPPHPPPYHPGT